VLWRPAAAPGATAAWDGRATIDHWPSYEWTLGSYSYRRGQYQAFGAVESEIEGGVHFCGEHTTQDFQGYLNGAVPTGSARQARCWAPCEPARASFGQVPRIHTA